MGEIILKKISSAQRKEIHAHRVIAIQNEIVKKVATIKEKSEEWRNETIRKRDMNMAMVRKNLTNITSTIQEKHEMVRRQINEAAIHREVNIRVNRGLEALERFIQILRETNQMDNVMERAVYDPIVSRTIKSEARKAIASDFFKAVQKQAVMQTEFINIAAHELRTPIMPIIINAEILQLEIGNNEEINAIIRNAIRLKRLTENILNVTRIESNSLTLNPIEFDLNTTIREVIREEKFNANKKIDFIFNSKDEKIVIIADKERLTQVIFNILNNAIKFTTNKIWINSQMIDDYVTVTIEDNGTGVDPKILPVLFTKFTTKSYQGTGLGLYISKRIIDSHGGEISSGISEYSSGARFTFTIPIRSKHQ